MQSFNTASDRILSCCGEEEEHDSLLTSHMFP